MSYGNEMRPIKTLNVPQIDSYIMTATLDLPLDLTIAALRKAGTGDSLLAALDALVTVTDEVADVTDSVEVLEVEDSETVELF